jgi:hypothetical protein
MNRIPGRRKHVRAYRWLPDLQAWQFFDVDRNGINTGVLPDGPAAMKELGQFVYECDLMRVRALKPRPFFPLAFTCVGAIKHLIGIRGLAVTPDQLWWACIRQGSAVTQFLAPDIPPQHEGARPADLRPAAS